MSVSVRAVDGVYGRSAVGLRARLERIDDRLAPVAHGETDGDGTIPGWSASCLQRGTHRIVFDSDRYFATLGVTAAYPEVVVTFRVLEESDNSLIQVVLSPYAYSTYFGTAA
ncbi:hydroxyisourate hydrolase [Rugosimonospora acidiphila]|uniref:Hydroxyisourate hydrolase n=1 Tax=Rugosimonospora acidiphila TaxID=556531 RepID=A0ABP9S4G8_9ACTN